MKTFLITAIGGDIGQAVAKTIRESRPELKLIGVDMLLRHAGSLFVDVFKQVPAARDPSYKDTLIQIMDEYNVDAVIVIAEPELAVLIDNKGELAGRPIISSGYGVVSVGLDKLTTARTLESLGIEAPWTVDADKEAPKNLPCMMKPRLGAGSKSLFVIENDTDREYHSNKYEGFVFQELLLPADQEVTCAVYRSRSGEIGVIQLRRILVGGMTGWAEVIDNNDVTKMCHEIAQGLDLKGSMNVQLRITEQGPRVFEINPRFSSTVVMRHRLGFSDVLWSLDELENKTVTFPQIASGQVVAKIQEAVIIND